VQRVDFAEGVDTGLRRYGEKFELFRVSLSASSFVWFHEQRDRAIVDDNRIDLDYKTVEA
jgi:hypothetical protein